MQENDREKSPDAGQNDESDNLSESEKEDMVKKALARRHKGKTSDIFIAILIVALLLITIYFLEKFIASPV